MKEDRTTRLTLAYLCLLNQMSASFKVCVEVLDRFELTDDEIAKLLKTSVEVVQKAR